MAGRFRLKGQALLDMGRGAKNAHQLSMRSQKSYPSVKSYVDGSDVRLVDLGVLAAILIDGQGLSPEQALELRLSDIFEFSPEP